MFLCTVYCICTNNSPGIFKLCRTEESNGRVEGRGRVKGREERRKRKEKEEEGNEKEEKRKSSEQGQTIRPAPGSEIGENDSSPLT